MERRIRTIEELFIQNLTFIILIVGLAIIGFFFRYMIRAYKGILAFIVGGIAIALLIFWVTEARKISSGLPIRKKLTSDIDDLDILDHGDTITIAGRIPGPSNLIKVGLQGKKLKITGGSNFSKELKLKGTYKLEKYNYRNGVLEVKLSKYDTKSKHDR